ncbi:CBS domain-containing protein [Halomonas binhaiensis]|uniref:CBS domain-containing protein n=1 Tax=Halomonas binhaiensis TaxID=2562282 RepID=A0A5C1NER2_9GAMM|nr:CBS domain-containing protein [Halomonas binhaiensis]QEM81686.1 CBS domain-containing protein [Halomonas binhaiensis]
MKILPLSRLNTADHLVTPLEFDDIEQDSPALSLMTDFRQHRPHTVSAETPALWVARLMATEEVDGKLVIDHHRNLIGLLTLERLSEQSLLAAQATLSINRESLTAADLMLPRAAMPALDYKDLAKATVADLVSTLQEAGEPYCLVRNDEYQQIRGLISLRELSERLHQQLALKPKSSVLKVLSHTLN